MSTTDDELWAGDTGMDQQDLDEVDQIVAASPLKSPPTAYHAINTGSPRGRTPSTAKRSAPARTFQDRSVSTERSAQHSAGSKRPRPLKIRKRTEQGEPILSPSRMTLSPENITSDQMEVEENEVIEMVDTDTESSDTSTRHTSFSFFDSQNTSISSVWSGSSGPTQSSASSPRKLDSIYPNLDKLREGSRVKTPRTALEYPETLDLSPRQFPQSPSKTRRTAPAALDGQNYGVPVSPPRSPSKRSVEESTTSPSALKPFVLPKGIFPRREDIFEGDVFGTPVGKRPARKRSEAGLPSHHANAPRSDPSGSSAVSPAFVQGSSRDVDGTPKRPVSPEKRPVRKPAVQPNVAKSYTTGDIPGDNIPLAPNPPTPADSRFDEEMVKATFGGNALALERVVIAHSSKHQKELEQLAWGVQYEVARGVTCGHWTWDDLTPEKLLQLRGRNAEAAHKVIPVMRGLPVPERKVSGLALWRDMDREQSAILENKGRGLGLMGEYDEAPNWYGGKIQQVVHLHKPEGSSSYSIFLKECEMRRSNRFARFLGSRRLLALHVPDKLLRDEYKDVLGFLCRKFVLMGRTYVPLHAKDGKLYLVEISEDFERRPNFQQGDQARLSLEELIRWYNPLAMNAKQPISKYTTRFALGFSTSVPVLEFEARNIHFIPDQIAPGVATRNAGPEQIMTDGCGFMNGAALLAIKNRMGYKNTPTAVQGRVAGSKGLWILHPNPEHQKPDGAPEIWIRDSQKKISLPEFSTVHRAHLIFDLICASRLRHPGRSSMQTVLNLHHNGVPTPVLTKLLSDGLRETAEELTNWDGPYAALLLMSAIDRAGRVSGSKLQRLAGGMSRALGFSGREFREAVEDENPFSAFDDDEDYDADDKDALNADFAFDPSSPPLSLHESAFELLRSGFLPLKSRFLSSKVREILTRLMEAATLGYHITIPWSLEGFIVPDPFGILGEGEVYLRTTREFEGMCSDTLEGPVLLSRNPTRVASDIQKVMAVKRPQLADYSDVLVVSTKGDRSLASYLGGGDYDGDTVMVVWDRDIVEPFRNARLCVPEPDFIAKNFHRDIEQVSSFVNRTSNLPRSEAHSALIKVLLQGMGDRKVGIYSKYHDIAVHSWGLAHAPTERLAHMFTHLLDSDKTGLRVNRDVMKRDQNQYDCAIPDCMKKQGGPDYEEYGHKRRLPRMKTLGPCVLCELMAVGKTERDRLLSKYDELQRGLNDLDQDVTAPWEDAERRAASNARGAEYVKADLDIVEDHVKKVYQAWRSIHWGSSTKPISSASPTKKVGKKSGGEQKSVEEMIQDVVKLYREGPTGISVVTSEREVSRWKAARAFKIGTYFAFRVAFWDICGIKAEAKGRSTSTGAIANLSTIPPSVLKVIQPGDD